MYGEQANKLIEDAKRATNLAVLPPYATNTVRAVTKEARDLDRDIQDILMPYRSSNTQSGDGTQQKSSFNPADDPAAACTLMVNHVSLRRNKRCLLAYHRTRTDKVEEMIWAGKDALDSQQTTGNAQQHDAANSSSLSAEEEQYVHQYSDLLAQFKGQWTDIDLTGSLVPPKDIFVDIRALKDVGEIQTEYGSLNLMKNSQHFVRYADVQGLIQQGLVIVTK
jgi:GINS complex subunit 1